MPWQSQFSLKHPFIFMQIPQNCKYYANLKTKQKQKKNLFYENKFVEPSSMQNIVDSHHRRHVKLSAIKLKIFKLALQSVTIQEIASNLYKSII